MKMCSSSSSTTTRFFLCVLLIFVAVLIEPSLSATERCHPVDKKVLLKIKKALSHGYLQPSWDPETDCCHSWYGVTCDETNHRVTSLAFMNSNLATFIPDDIGDLPYLTELFFHKLSNFSGPIPYSITKLQNLNMLDISWCNLTGTIPGFLSKLKKLTYLNLSFNKLTGPIPSSLSDLSGLSYLRLDRNQLSGTIPESLVKLKDNQLYLLLSHNEISGEVPASFRDIDFGQIELSRNKLQGDISMLFGPNKTTNFMYFDRNMFEFNMSKMELHPTLTQLDISHNKIYGGLPTEMINLQWQFLNVSYNRMCGPIPQGGRLQSDFDYSSYFHNRCLCGSPLNVTCN